MVCETSPQRQHWVEVSNDLQVQGLVVRFDGSFSVGPLSFAVECGTVHLVGRNGVGKTSLMRAMCGEIRPFAGSVTVGGRDIHRSKAARRNVAFVPSSSELPGFLTVREAYRFAASLRGSKDWDGAKYCDALNLDPALKLSIASEGERSKAEFVCGLAADPPVLLLDEPFAHIDHHSISQIATWVDNWTTAKVIVFTHHGRSPVHVDQVIELTSNSVKLG